jgi:hypothetical protein
VQGLVDAANHLGIRPHEHNEQDREDR